MRSRRPAHVHRPRRRRLHQPGSRGGNAAPKATDEELRVRLARVDIAHAVQLLAAWAMNNATATSGDELVRHLLASATHAHRRVARRLLLAAGDPTSAQREPPEPSAVAHRRRTAAAGAGAEAAFGGERLRAAGAIERGAGAKSSRTRARSGRRARRRALTNPRPRKPADAWPWTRRAACARRRSHYSKTRR